MRELNLQWSLLRKALHKEDCSRGDVDVCRNSAARSRKRKLNNKTKPPDKGRVNVALDIRGENRYPLKFSMR